MDDTLPVMLISSLLKDGRERRIIHKDIDDDCGHNGATTTDPGLPAECPITTPREGTTTSTLKEHEIKQAKDDFCGQVAGKIRTPRSCYSYDRHCILIRIAPPDGATRTVVLNLL